MDFPDVDERFANFFDEVVIPVNDKRHELHPKAYVSRGNASDLRCSSNADKRILEADHRLIIVGGGPAGLAAAVYAARADMGPLVVAKDGGQLEATSWIDNYPGFEEGVDAVDLIVRLGNQAKRF